MCGMIAVATAHGRFLLGVLAYAVGATLVPFCRPAQPHRTAALHRSVAPNCLVCVRGMTITPEYMVLAPPESHIGVGYCCCT